MQKAKVDEKIDKKGGIGKKKDPEEEIPELPEIEIPEKLTTVEENIREKYMRLTTVTMRSSF